MQIAWRCDLTSDSYVRTKAWEQANIERCPTCRRGRGQGFSGHGSYARKQPEGARIARFYCQACQKTFSLLPSCLSSCYGDTLVQLQTVLDTVAACSTFDAAVRSLRPEIGLQGGRRWVRRRCLRIHLALLLCVTARGAGDETLGLGAVRETLTASLAQVPTPLGFGHRPLSHWQAQKPLQQPMGPDPPPSPG